MTSVLAAACAASRNRGVRRAAAAAPQVKYPVRPCNPPTAWALVSLQGRFKDLEGSLVRIYVWLRYSAVRQLTWQRNYNTQASWRVAPTAAPQAGVAGCMPSGGWLSPAKLDCRSRRVAAAMPPGFHCRSHSVAAAFATV